MVEVEKFRWRRNKLAYASCLTPRDMATKILTTRRFLERKRQEYEMLRTQIAKLETGVGEDR